MQIKKTLKVLGISDVQSAVLCQLRGEDDDFGTIIIDMDYARRVDFPLDVEVGGKLNLVFTPGQSANPKQIEFKIDQLVRTQISFQFPDYPRTEVFMELSGRHSRNLTWNPSHLKLYLPRRRQYRQLRALPFGTFMTLTFE